MIATCRAPAKVAEPAPKKKVKQGTKWDLQGNNKDMKDLDIFNTDQNKDEVHVSSSELQLRGTGGGQLKDLESESEDEVVEEAVDSGRNSKRFVSS